MTRVLTLASLDPTQTLTLTQTPTTLALSLKEHQRAIFYNHQ